MTTNVKMILDEVNARIKLAEAKTAEDPSNFDAFPGAENDQAVPAETKKPDPEVKDEGPASRTEVSGAKPGSDVPLQQDHLYEADEPVLTPDKKPADSADAEAKEASANPNVEKVAADILNIIKDAMNKKAEEASTAEAEVENPDAESAAEKEKDAGCCSKGKKCKKPVKKAEETISLEQRLLDKLASIKMAKEAGAADAKALLKAASEYNRGAADARALIQKLAQALEESANSANDAECAECADGSAGGCSTETPEAAGAADAEAALADAAAMDGEAAQAALGDDPVTPEEVAEAVTELVDEGQISPEDAATLVEQISGGATADPSAGADVPDEQIADGIIQAIESGEITEDEAQQLVQELVDAGADATVQEDVAAAGADAVAAEDPAAAGAADAEAALADAAAMDAQKQAADKQATSITGQKEKKAEDLTKQAEEEQIAKYQQGFIQKCAEYGADPRLVAQYIQARAAGQL